MRGIFLVFFILILLASSYAEAKGSQRVSDKTLKSLRMNMVKTQIEERGIKDPLVLKAMNEIERHQFVPNSLVQFAYEDNPLPIGMGQTISQPYIVAYMTERLKLAPNHKVLEIGTGSGYQTAVLAKISKNIFSIEIVTDLCKQAKKTLKKVGISNVTLNCGDGYIGWKEHAPFDRIILTASPPKIPQPLIDQLANNGILIAPEGRDIQSLVEISKDKNGKITKRQLLGVRFVPMTGKAQEN